MYVQKLDVHDFFTILFDVGHAATIQVDSEGDLPNITECTLRKAISSIGQRILLEGCSNLSEEAFGVNDTVVFSGSLPNRKITLSGSPLPILSTVLKIDASLNGGVTISADNKSRVFSAAFSVIEFNFISITEGTINASGGGMSLLNSTVTLNNSSVLNNRAVTTARNSGDHDGGGIFANESSVTLLNTTVDGNIAVDSSVSNGGGIRIENGFLAVNNSTISNNSSQSLGGSAGGISAFESVIEINNSTLSNNINNSPLGRGHTLVVAGSSSSTSIKNSSIVSTNIQPNPSRQNVVIDVIAGANVSISNSIVLATDDIVTCNVEDGLLNLQGGNLSSDGNCGLQSSNINLGELADNGCFLFHLGTNGLTCVKTHALLENSVAIDSAVDSDSIRDQRGELRKLGFEDVGAFEVASPPTISDEQLFIVPLKNKKAMFIYL